jgi:hypothetical protein
MRTPMARKYRQGGAMEPYRAVLLNVVAGNDVEDGRLAAAVWPNQTVDLTCPDFEIDTVDRFYPAKAQRHLFKGQGTGIARHVEQLLEEIRSRDDGAPAGKRSSILEIQKLGNSARYRKHDNEQ